MLPEVFEQPAVGSVAGSAAGSMEKHVYRIINRDVTTANYALLRHCKAYLDHRYSNDSDIPDNGDGKQTARPAAISLCSSQ